MLQNSKFALLSGLALAATLVSGCLIQGNDRILPPEETGALTVLWTVDGTTDPDACFDLGGGTTDFELLIGRGTEPEDSVYAPCEDFGLTVDLEPATYNGYATLVDSRENPVTTTLPLKDLVVVEDTELTVDVDFPPGAFLPL